MASTTPLPTNLKVLRGTAQPCRLNDREPIPPKGKVAMPAGLTDKEKKHWKEVSTHLEEAGVLSLMDVQALRMYCNAYTGWLDANKKLDDLGTIIKSIQGQPILSPYFKVSQKYFDQLLSILREFGMTPSSRTRIRADNPAPEDEFDAWQKRKRMARDGV